MRFQTSHPVTNISETVAFYRVLFDGAPVKTQRDYAKFMPATTALTISFHESPGDVRGLASLHLGLEMPDRAALERMHARLAAAGMISDKRTTSICCYANQDKFWVTDPDGYRWEVYLLLEDTEMKVASAATCCASQVDDAASVACGSTIPSDVPR